jgi:N-acetylgalactosamine kinase
MSESLDLLYAKVKAGHAAAFGEGEHIRIARAPGRVNIIGEHTDYNGLPVLPTAIDREIVIAYESSDSHDIRLVNIDPSFGERGFDASDAIDPYEAGDWGNYAKAAAQALWVWAGEHAPALLPLRGFSGCVGGSIPAGSGLSSSSAMVVAIAVALVDVNRLPIVPEELASVLARGEQYVGTQGGGMDQAASLLSKPGCAIRIDFGPLRAVAVPVPEDCVFLIANSMVRAEKAGAARVAYNTRVAECRLGVQMLKKLARREYPEVEQARLLGDVMRSVPEWQGLVESLPVGALTLGQVSEHAGIPEDILRDECLRLPDELGVFEVKKRCRHVFTEAERVGQAEEALRRGDIVALGRLLDASHESCARDYEVSCPELDELVATLRRHGALGARLTGAGFGGCAVAVVERASAEHIVSAVWQDYHQRYARNLGASTESRRDEVIFACVPSTGAGVQQ